MRKYHPDRHAGSPDKQKAATEVAQKLTLAYRLIEKRSRSNMTLAEPASFRGLPLTIT
jgi:DnaJ-class molecular chaperone